MKYYGDFAAGETVVLPFNTFDSDGASVTVTNLVAGDVEIHKDGGTTQRSSDAGITVSIDFDGVTGNHLIIIDTSDNTDAGFYSTGSDYQVRVEGITVDSQTINAFIGSFSIENRFMRGTDSAALASVCTETRLAELDAANLPANVDAVLADTNELQTDDVPGLISALNNVSSADVQSACDSAITANTDIDAILADTNELQTDLTNGGRLDLILDELTSQGDTNETKIDTIDTVVDAVKAKTDNLPADPASETNVNANETKIDTIDTVVDAIKTKTDGLNFTGDDVKATLDGEEVTTDSASRTASKADVSNLDVAVSSRSSHTAANVKTAMEAAGSYLKFVKDVTEGDATIDTTTTPWQLVVKIKGTATELVRKDLKDSSGGNIGDVNTVIGQQLEP